METIRSLRIIAVILRRKKEQQQQKAWSTNNSVQKLNPQVEIYH